MEPISRKSLVDAVEARLLEELRKGTWTGQLPGVRILCARLQVSPPTMLAALKRLIASGVLEDRGERRRLAIKFDAGAATGGGAAGEERKRLLILTHHAFHLTADSARNVLEHLQDALAGRWLVSHEVLDFFNAKRPHQCWDECLRSNQPDAILGVFGRPVLARWAQKHRTPMLFLGGVAGNTDVPIYAVRVADMLRAAVRQLLAAGHQKFFLPLCERAEPFAASLIQVMEEELRAAGVTFVQRVHAPSVGYAGPDVLWRLAETAWKTYRPTAWLIIDWREMVTISGFFHQQGIFMPKDVSSILLISETTSDWHRPTLCRFEPPAEKVARHIMRWLDGKADRRESKYFEATWMPGESIGPCSQG